MLQQSSYTIKARMWPVWILFAFNGIPGYIITVTSANKLIGLYFIIASVAVCLLLVFITRSMRIEIDDEMMIYHRYGRKTTMRWKEIAAATISWSIEGAHSAGPSWIVESFDHKTIEIPLGYYSRSDMRILAEQTIQYTEQAQISPKIHRLAEGKFPWYLF